MANLEVLALDTAVPQIRAPGAGDGYSVPRDMTMASGTTLAAQAVTSTSLGTTGNLTFSSTAQRITGDMSNATVANRLFFQNSTTNAVTRVGAIPNGTATESGYNFYNTSAVTTGEFGQLYITSSEVTLRSAVLAGGSFLPMTFYTGGSERMRLDTSGNLGIGKTAATGVILDANGVSRSTQIQMTNSAGTYTGGSAGFHLFGFSDNNLYFNWFDAGAIVFRNNGANERMRIDSSGNVGIGGTASSFSKFEVTGTLPTSSNTTQTIRQSGTLPSGSTSESYGYVNVLNTAAASFTCAGYSHYFAFQSALGAGSAVTNQFGFHVGSTLTGATNNYGFYSDIASGSNRWNFFANGTAQNHMAGRLGIGNTTFVDSEMLRITQASAKQALFIDITAASSTANAAISIRKYDNDNTTAQTYVAFAYNNGASGAGGIQGNGGTGPQFFNSSDARLKENVADLDGQLAKIMALKPRTFDFIDGPKGCTGFIAQEMEQVYPDAVGVDKDGYKTIGGVSIMEARLIKAIQELSAKVAALEAR